MNILPTEACVHQRIRAYNECVAKHDWLKVEGYDEVLDSLALSQPEDSPEYVSVRICGPQPLVGSEGFPPVDLWLPSEHLGKLDNLRILIRKGLAELGHPVSDPVVDSLLPLFPMAPDVGRAKLARLFSSFRMSSMTQTLVLPFPHDDSEEAGPPVMMGNFALKPFRSALKVSAALAAKSPLGISTSTLEERDGNWSIERTFEALPF